MLQQTELDFRARGLPFPRVEPSPKDRRQPRECHLFSDPACPDAPVVLHFPLVNASFKDHSAPGEAAPPPLTKSLAVRSAQALSWALPCPCGQQREESLKLVRPSVGHGRTLACGACPDPCKVTGLRVSVMTPGSAGLP